MMAAANGAGRAHRLALALLGAALIWRLGLAAWLPLGIDEAYAVAVAREFSWSFFDHPPLGFWLPVAMAQLTGWEHPFVYRLPFVLLGTLTGWALWRMGTLLGGARAGLFTVALWLIAPHMVFGSGLFVVPDAPLNAGGALAMLALVAAMRAGPGQHPHPAVWLGFGAGLALALASKYQAGLLALAALGFFLFTPRWRHWLAHPAPWAGAVLALMGLLPVLLWNLQTDWASLRFHGGRTGGGFAPGNLAAMSAAQLLYLLPPVLVLALLGLRAALRREASGAARLLAWAALLPLAVFMLVYAFGADTLPHWTMPGWLFALPLAGAWLAQASGRARRHARWWLIGFGLPIWALLIAVALHLPTGLLTRGSEQPRGWDRQTEIIDLRGLAPALAAGGWLEDVAALAVPGWMEGGQVSTALGGALPVVVLGPDRRHFGFHAAPPQGRWLLVLVGHESGRGALPAQADDLATEAGLAITRAGLAVLERGGRDHLAAGLYWLEPSRD